jgi:hypothetical protein
MTALQKTLVGAALAAAVGVATYQAREAARLSRENRSLQTEQERLAGERDDARKGLRGATRAAPRLPAPPVAAGASLAPAAAADLPPTRRLCALLKGEPPKLTSEQIESFLQANHRNAASLLAMSRITGDKSYLKEAMEKFPNDPRVAFDAVRTSDSPEERRQWLDKFKENAPDNALASYLSALDYFKSGQTDRAVRELMAAAGRPELNDYSWDYAQDGVEAWRAAGYSEAEARVLGIWRLPLPHVAQLKQLHQNVLDLAGAYRQAGDEASAQAALQYNLLLGQQLAGYATDPLIHQMVGLIIQRNTLAAFDPNAPYDTGGQTYGERMAQLEQQRKGLKDLFDYTQDTLQFAMSPRDWITFSDRARAFGEQNAVQWLMDKYDPAPLRSFWDGERLVPVETLSKPLSAWLAANHGQAPTDPAQLLPFVTTPEQRSVLDRLTQNLPAMSDDEKAALQKWATVATGP